MHSAEAPSRCGGPSRSSGSPASAMPRCGWPSSTAPTTRGRTGLGGAGRDDGVDGRHHLRLRAPGRRTRVLLSVDVAVTACLLLCTAALQYPQSPRQGVAPITATWVAGPVLAWAVRLRPPGAIAALVVLAAASWCWCGQRCLAPALNGPILLLLAGVVVGLRVPARGRARAERCSSAAEVEAASRERERLARDIHDSVLQVLALVQRRGAEAGGDGGRDSAGWPASRKPRCVHWLAAGPAGTAAGSRRRAGELDLRSADCCPPRLDRVTVVTPGRAGPGCGSAAARRPALGGPRGAGQRAAALRGHGRRAGCWSRTSRDLVTVTIRDDGPGIPDGRLAEAAAAGRLGVSQSIRGRLRDLGGSAEHQLRARRGHRGGAAPAARAGRAGGRSPEPGLRCGRGTQRPDPGHGRR